MDAGDQRRTVAATKMNDSSSRAHTIISIEFKEIKRNNRRKSEKISVINLVDLTCQKKQTKQVLKGQIQRRKIICYIKAGNINKSLTILGKVIAILADKLMVKAKNVVLPSRESQLTRILQNALGGNSKTLMIFASSPATIYYQAKKVKICANINESDVDKKLRQYQEEIHSLKQQLILLQQQIQFGNINPTMLEKLNQTLDDIETGETIMQENQESFQQKLEKQKIIDEERG